MKNIITIFVLLLLSTASFSQKTIEPTDGFTVFGLVQKPLTIRYSDVEKDTIITLGDFKVTNHLGEFKKEYKNVKGVLLLNLLKNLNITAGSPKLLSGYYLVFKASDGYAVVVSWNELFNTETGNSFFLVVEADNKSEKDSPERMLLISTKDFKTGRRFIKGLQSIEVKKI